jgi:IPT/TIG domain
MSNQTQEQRQREQHAREQQAQHQRDATRPPATQQAPPDHQMMPPPGHREQLQTPQQRQDEQRQRDRDQRDTREGHRSERNALAQNTGGADQSVDRGALNSKIAAEYDATEQPGLHPANMPGRRLQGDGRDHKANVDLEDVTGNPGHLNVNPNAPATSINPAPVASEGPDSINEPPGVKLATAPESLPHSINEPPGSQVVPPPTEGGGQPGGGGALDLTSIDPESVAIGSMTDFTLTVTGTGFDQQCKIVFDDEELPTTYVNETTLTANPPMATAADSVDVEVARGEEMSDVLTFEFTEGAARSSRKAERKPKKKEPAHKRQKKGRR